MAIQKINLGTEPLGEGGDTYRSANTKINENFSNTTHAASQLMVSAGGIVPSFNNYGIQGTGVGGVSVPESRELPPNGSIRKVRGADINLESGSNWNGVYSLVTGNDWSTYLAWAQTTPTSWFIGGKTYGEFTHWAKIYTDRNTTKDTATGFLKASSPVLHVYNDSVTKIHEAEQLDITVDKKGVGHYEIHGTTGLRKNDGWFMSPPRDVHGNVLCMVELEEKDGVITLKTYKKLFDFETVSIVHDYENPMDIPEGVCVEFRFNDLPQEQLGGDEPVEESVVNEVEESKQ